MAKSNERKVAIVTGGAQGIGRAIVENLISNNIHVLVMEHDRSAGREIVSELDHTSRIEFFPGNVSNEKEVKQAISKAKSINGRIDYLVNNAGIMQNKSLQKLTLREWNHILSTNLTGIFLMSKYAAPFLSRSKGAIVNIASTRALMSEKNTEAYSASKGGIVAITHSLAISLGPKVRVNCICPGWIETSDWKKKGSRHKPHHTQKDREQHPVGRVGTPEDIAFLVEFLLSEKAGFITGANYVVDGGMTRKMIYD